MYADPAQHGALVKKCPWSTLSPLRVCVPVALLMNEEVFTSHKPARQILSLALTYS